MFNIFNGYAEPQATIFEKTETVLAILGFSVLLSLIVNFVAFH